MSVIAETSLTKHSEQFAHTLKRGAPLFSDGFERCGNLVGGRLFALCFGSVQHADTIDGLTNHAVQRGGDFSLNAGTDTVAFHIRRENTLLLLLGHQRFLSRLQHQCV